MLVPSSVAPQPRGSLLASARAIVLALTLAGTLAACAGDKKEIEYVEQPVEQLYDAAFDLLEKKRYSDAALAFDEVERQHPYSIWARRAMLMSAFSYYQANKYEDAVNAADRFLKLHPGNKDAPYAYYLKALCSYEQILDVGRDQQATQDALASLEEIVRRYPTSEYARDARLKIDLTRDHLAGKEMAVGRFYLQRDQHVAAIARFRSVLELYQTTSHVPEALHRLTEAYLELGVDAEAQAAAAVLGYNFPDSDWYRDSYRLLQAKDLEPKSDEGSWISKTVKRVF